MSTTLRKLISRGSVAFLIHIILIGIAGNLKASHLVGGELTYEWISGNDYKIRLEYYRDCAGITQPPSINLTMDATSCGFITQTAVLNMVGTPIMITPICQASLLNTVCNGGLLYAVEKSTYEAIVTLQGVCSNWQFSVNECCRNGAITNLVSPDAYGSYFSATLNNADFPFNNSVRFGTLPTSILANATTNSLSWNSYDVDGDSLVYELVSPRDFLNNVPVDLNFIPGLSAQEPFVSSIPTNLNVVNGTITVTPNGTQVAVVAMKISEYREGIMVGEVYRDYQFAVMNSTNSLPSLSGINGTSSFITNVCPGDTLMFDIFSSDPDAGQILTLNLGTNNTSLGFTSTGNPVPTGSFFWIPQVTDISSQPYVFTVDVNDDFCAYYGTQTYAYQVYVNGCNTNDVWPGDANSDGVANLYDLLAVGLAYNDAGPVRPAASLSWVAQQSTNWNNSFLSGINHKHADTDGNGIVNINDTTAILLNYGLNHPLRNSTPSMLNVAELTVTASSDTIGMQAGVHFDIALSSVVDSIYGLAFRLYFDPNLVDLSTLDISYANSLFGTNGVNMVKLDKTLGGTGFVDFALARIDQQNISGSGQIARITIVTTDNVAGKVTLNVEPFDVEAITAFENIVTVTTSGDNVVIDPNYVGIYENIQAQLFNVYPTPASDLFFIDYMGKETISLIQLFDINGKELLAIPTPKNKTAINISHFSNGVYYIKAVIGETTIIKKIVKL